MPCTSQWTNKKGDFSLKNSAHTANTLTLHHPAKLANPVLPLFCLKKQCILNISTCCAQDLQKCLPEIDVAGISLRPCQCHIEDVDEQKIIDKAFTLAIILGGVLIFSRCTRQLDCMKLLEP